MWISDRRLKKYLQEQAEKDAEVFLTEKDEEFIRQLVKADGKQNIEEKTEKQKRKNKKDK